MAKTPKKSAAPKSAKPPPKPAAIPPKGAKAKGR